ncbi:hypothetical protein PR001_g13074 [Phytophthora rubi]|uniref:Mnd1 HTH domain-containing protein n=1 Tax=Phytophthora rubi TaxID=129364 RepID=A0A6A3LXB9_9STRA|nr:hypothetical protein PR001_g13074 [Phytophthora rubi]
MTGIGGTYASSNGVCTQNLLEPGATCYGVSLQEKREHILHIYHESKDVFNLKKLEKLGSKAGVGAPKDRHCRYRKNSLK